MADPAAVKQMREGNNLPSRFQWSDKESQTSLKNRDE
jgi:hypothetical protein